MCLLAGLFSGMIIQAEYLAPGLQIFVTPELREMHGNLIVSHRMALTICFPMSGLLAAGFSYAEAPALRGLSYVLSSIALAFLALSPFFHDVIWLMSGSPGWSDVVLHHAGFGGALLFGLGLITGGYIWRQRGGLSLEAAVYVVFALVFLVASLIVNPEAGDGSVSVRDIIMSGFHAAALVGALCALAMLSLMRKERSRLWSVALTVAHGGVISLVGAVLIFRPLLLGRGRPMQYSDVPHMFEPASFVTSMAGIVLGLLLALGYIRFMRIGWRRPDEIAPVTRHF
ncbi:MAG: hypothetical protein CMK07_14150 [Ponticaulis sp.]|nr:hypothetical protein [Ponticaulis sp.]